MPYREELSSKIIEKLEIIYVEDELDKEVTMRIREQVKCDCKFCDHYSELIRCYTDNKYDDCKYYISVISRLMGNFLQY